MVGTVCIGVEALKEVPFVVTLLTKEEVETVLAHVSDVHDGGLAVEALVMLVSNDLRFEDSLELVLLAVLPGR